MNNEVRFLAAAIPSTRRRPTGKSRYEHQSHAVRERARYLRLKAALVSGGLIRGDPAYESLVDAALSRAA